MELHRNRTRLGLVALAAALAVTALGCGRHGSDQQASTASSTSLAVPVAQVGTAPVASTGSKSNQNGSQESSPVVTSADSLPPEVTVSAPDSLIVPGSVVEILAEGTPDVTGMLLSDGIGKKQPFAYDSTAKLWRAFYRVPIRTPNERLALSVTAKNGANRWRRVWVFFNVDNGETEADE